jgi:hypothetical protein
MGGHAAPAPAAVRKEQFPMWEILILVAVLVVWMVVAGRFLPSGGGC